MNVTLSNTFSRTKEVFKAKNDSSPVMLYVCGITPYSYSHIGHARVYIVFDVLVRLLKVLGKEVTYIRNFTDIDDKILDRIPGDHTNITKKITDFVEPFVKDYHAGLAALNCIPATFEPRVTQTIPEIIDLVERLIAAGHAYVLDGSVYFDIASFSSYGRLSGHPLENLLAGSRIDVDDKKKNPGDFALWKGNDQDLYWPSPWGFGRPGWHIECSAMVSKHALTLDIHGGGADLLFPHHENERAQSEAGYECELSNYWMHVEFLLMNKEKMSKSLGNVMLMRDVLRDYNPMAFRFFVLQHVYNKPLNFSTEDLEAAGKAFDRLNELFWSAQSLSLTNFMRAIEVQEVSFVNEALVALCDDLNSARSIAFFFQYIDELKKSERIKVVAKAFMEHVLGLVFVQPKEQDIPEDVRQLMRAREASRSARDWVKADLLRAEIVSRGFEVQDKKK